MNKIAIEKYRSEYKEQVLELLSYLWNSLNAEERKKRFEWRYENNPCTDSPMCYLALDGEKIVGNRAFVVQKFKLKEKEYLMVTPADSVVHPEYRRHGIFSKIIEASNQDLVSNTEVKFILSLSSNKASTAATLKYGYTPVGKRDYLYHVSYTNILKKTSFPEKSIMINKNGLRFEITKNLKPKMIFRLMDKVAERDKIHNIRNEKFYEWIFSNPLKDYIFTYCSKDDELIGYICIEKTGDKFVTLKEYGYLDITYLEELIKITRKNIITPCIMAYLFTRSKEEKELLSKIGFKGKNNIQIKMLNKMNIIKGHDLPGALIQPLSENITEEDYILNGKDVRDPNNWSLFPSDIH